jgi:hypothetical protein
MRYELPDGLLPEEEKALIAALERYCADYTEQPDPWAMAGRIENVRIGALQARDKLPTAWQSATRLPYARRETPPLHGRGDAR